LTWNLLIGAVIVLVGVAVAEGRFGKAATSRSFWGVHVRTHWLAKDHRYSRSMGDKRR
jgi:hypothetical protein